jgi:hypothetical protein
VLILFLRGWGMLGPFHSLLALLLLFLFPLWRYCVALDAMECPLHPDHRQFPPTSTSSTLPLCTDRKRTSLHLSDGSFITKEKSQWYKRSDGSMEYRPNSCQLKRFEIHEARQCLNHQHLLFIGDSLSRFQYLSLIYFLENGSWLSHFRMDPNCTHLDDNKVPQCRRPGEPNLNDPHNRNYKALHVGLGSNYFNGNLECQCFRGHVERSVENMFYESHIDSANTRTSILKATYMSDNIVFPMKGWKRSHCSASSSCQMNLTHWFEFGEKKWDYEFFDDDPHLYDHLLNVIPDVNIALINRGLWTEIPTNATAMTIIFKKLSQMIAKNSGRCFWKGTTVPMEPKMTELLGYFPTADNFTLLERPIRHLSHRHMCESFDLSHVTSDFVDMLGTDYCLKNNATWNSRSRYKMTDVYIDRVHFQPWVYEEFNQILLNILC